MKAIRRDGDEEAVRRGGHSEVTAHCRLRARLVRQGGGVWLLAERPLRLLRVHPKVEPLLQALRDDPDVERALKAVPGLRRESAIAFLERLSDEGLAYLTWSVPDELLPTVSIVVPVRNRPRQLDACLAALARLEYPSDRWEVIVVDDASSDDTAARAEAWKERLALQLIRLPQQVGAAECRNQGARAARGEIIAFTDSDCLPHPRWLRELAPEFVRPSVVAVGGAVLPVDEAAWLDRYEAVESPLTHGWEPVRVQPRGAVPYLVTANMLVRRQALLDAGGFARIHPGEDVDLIWRLCARGGRVLYRPQGLVAHDHRDRLWPFLVRRASYASSEVVLVRRHPQYRHAVVMPVALALGAGWALWCWRRCSRWVFLFSLVPLLADLVAAVSSVRRSGAHLPVRTLVRAELRGMLAATYWLGGTISRYYTWPLLTLGAVLRRRPLGRWLTLVAWSSLIATAGADYARKRPRLDPFRFVFGHILDDLANNVGLLFGCVRYRTLRPLLVELRLYWPRFRPE